MQRFRWFAIVFAAVVLMIDVSQVKAQERTLEEVKAATTGPCWYQVY